MGGLFGYSSVNSIVNLNVPSSNGVSCGLQNKRIHTLQIFTVETPKITVLKMEWFCFKMHCNAELKIRGGEDNSRITFLLFNENIMLCPLIRIILTRRF